jgi:branched-chain amino acid transport system permease protein
VKGIYVALLTFIFAQLLHQLVLSQGSLTGGSSGLVGLPPLELGGTVFADNGQLGYYALGGAVLVVVMAGLTLLTRSAFGLSLMALRDEEEYARSRGVPLFRQHLLAFILSGVIASIAGGIYAFVIGVVSPELFGFGYVSLVLSMVFLGGAGTLWGPVAGAVVITVISDRLRNDGPWQYIVVSVIILVVLWLFPGGLAGLLAKAQQLLGGRRFGRRTAPEPERVSS